MIKIYTNKENYQYDIHSLIKAFYPEHDVKVQDISEKNMTSMSEMESFCEVIIGEESIELIIAVLDSGEKKYYKQVIDNNGKNG